METCGGGRATRGGRRAGMARSGRSFVVLWRGGEDDVDDEGRLCIVIVAGDVVGVVASKGANDGIGGAVKVVLWRLVGEGQMREL